MRIFPTLDYGQGLTFLKDATCIFQTHLWADSSWDIFLGFSNVSVLVFGNKILFLGKCLEPHGNGCPCGKSLSSGSGNETTHE